MITFETLRKIEQEEKGGGTLVKLPDGFMQEVLSYTKRKEHANAEKDDSWELDSARMVIKGIFETRDKKILIFAFRASDSDVVPDNMTPEETEFFNSLVKDIKAFRSKRLSSMEEDVVKTDVVALLEDIPVFVGTDMKNHGPFRKGDVATLPEDIATVLVEKNAARKIDNL